MVRILNRFCLQDYAASRFRLAAEECFVTQCQVATEDLVVCGEQSVHIALISANQVMVRDIVIVKDFKFESLVLFKLIVDRERLEECRVKTVCYVWCLANVAPLLVFLCFDV